MTKYSCVRFTSTQFGHWRRASERANERERGVGSCRVASVQSINTCYQLAAATSTTTPLHRQRQQQQQSLSLALLSCECWCLVNSGILRESHPWTSELATKDRPMGAVCTHGQRGRGSAGVTGMAWPPGRRTFQQSLHFSRPLHPHGPLHLY